MFFFFFAKPDHVTLRKLASNWMLSHRDDFAPFLTTEDGDSLDEGNALLYIYITQCNI